ncbi:MAG: hypothetical protein L3J82_07895, partial [Planctomycetes bacterium]|nr:hypothetical protein [Planctomycetota bacterium]
MNNNKSARTAAIILSGQPYQSTKQAEQLAKAMFGDLHELLGAMKLSVPEGGSLASQSQLAKAIQAAEGNIIITWADAAATPLHAVSGALDALKSATAVVGPCANGEIYLFGFEGPVDAELAEEISEILFQEKPLDELTNLLDDLVSPGIIQTKTFTFNTFKANKSANSRSLRISFHCINSVFDTTMILDACENGDSMNVCLTGNDFSNRYGHHQGERHMGHMSNSQNSWMHHLDDEHQAGDYHY